MFFRSASLILFSLVLASCVGKIGEEPPPQQDQKIEGTQCLSDALPVVSKFLDGEAQEKELAVAWDCVNLAMSKFQRYVRGSKADQYSVQELTTFLEDNFFDQKSRKRVSPELQREMMRIKQLFVGGSLEYITRKELEDSIRVFSEFKAISLKLNPYMKIFTMNWKDIKQTDNDVRFFEEGNEVIQDVARSLSSLVIRNTISYRLDDFVKLMAEFEKFYQEEWEVVESIDRFMPVVKKVKKAIAGGDEALVAPNEWESFVLLGARGYVQFLRYHYFIKSAPETNSGVKLSYVARSFEDGLSVFKDLVEVKPSGVVTREEFSDILFSFSRAWPEFKISDELIVELMRIKQLAFGGTIEAWSTRDFETAKLKVNRLKFIFERFWPYYDVYGRTWDSSYLDPVDAEQFFSDAQFNLEASAQELGALLETSYKLENLSVLLNEIDKLYPSGDESKKSLSQIVSEALPAIVELKNITYGQKDDVIQRNNWSSFLRLGARAYSVYLYYEYFNQDSTLDNEQGVSNFSILVTKGISLFRDLLAQKFDGEGISKEQLLSLVLKLEPLGALPEGFDEKVISSLLNAAFDHLLVEPKARLEKSYQPNFNMLTLDFIAREFKIWEEGQRWGLVLFNQKPRWSVSEINEVLSKDLAATTDSVHKAPALSELQIGLSSPVPMTVNNESFLNISNKVDWQYDWKSFAKINLHRSLARLAINAYTNDLNRIQTYAGFNLAEAEFAFTQLRPVFVQLELLDETNLTFMSSRFREGNIFTPRGDGNNLISFAEAVDLISILWSGINVHESMIDEVVKQCLPGVSKPGFKDRVALGCVRAAYYREMPLKMTGTLGYLEYIKSQPQSEWNIYFTNIIKAAGYDNNAAGLVNYSDLSLVPQVVQYIEMIYAKFDRNKDGIISTPDALRAFPSFKALMLELAAEQLASGSIKEEDLDDVFTFILRYGKPPETIGEQLRFLFNWRNKPDKWDVWADRTQISKILGYIADQVSKDKAKKKAAAEKLARETQEYLKKNPQPEPPAAPAENFWLGGM
ncbi:MAG: hypothetical protein ACLGGX_06395 [Bdellovibrionia bacterium]